MARECDCTDVLHTHMQMHAEHNDTIKTSDTVLQKNIPLTLLKGLCVRGSWRPNRTATYWPPLLWPSAFLSHSSGLLNQGLRAHSAGCWLSLLHLVSNSSDLKLPDILSSPGLYNHSMPIFFLWASQIALIQPIHGQGYILIIPDRMHLLFTQVYFLFWQSGRVRAQYTTDGYWPEILACSSS